VAQRVRIDKTGLTLAGLSVLLAAVNVYVCRELFRIEYLNHPGSIEAAFISIARYARDTFPDLTWFPVWYNGIPYQNSYPPLLHWVVAAVSRVTDWPAALAYHATVAFFYCFGPVALFWLCYRLSRSLGVSFFGGLLHSVVSPSAFLIGDVRRDLGSLMRPRRLQTLVIYGEGPHVAGLALLAVSILLLDIAIRKRRPLWYVLAAASCAATALTNWLAAAALAIAVASYLLAQDRTQLTRSAVAVVLIAVAAYAFAAPWVPPSTIRTIQFNARTIEGDYTQYARGLPLRLLALAAVLALAKFALARVRASRALQFGAYFTIVTGAIALSWEYARMVFVPQPHRYHIEMEWGIAILVPFALAPLIRRIPPRAQMAVAIACILAAVPFAKAGRRYARYIIEPVDMRTRVEYKIARWVDANLRGERVMLPGSSSFWLNAFTDTPQLGGGFDQGTTNFLIRVALYVLYSSDGTGDRDTEISLAWLKVFGVHAVATGGPGSGEYFKPFRNPRKFDGKLDVLWRDGDDVLYRVRARTFSLAHALTRAGLPARAPVNGIDIEPLRPYLKALDDPALPPANAWWTSRHSMIIGAQLKPEHLVSVQISYDRGWRAKANGRAAGVSGDPLGQLVIEPDCDGACTIELVYDGGLEARLARIAFLAALAGSALWIVWSIRASRAA
jgi:hypothetical protein